MKELQLTPSIEPHDFATKLAHAIAFLGDDMKVCVRLRFRGRQRAHKEYGFEMINRFLKEAAAYGQADSPPKLLGDRDLNVIISPLPRDKRPKTKPAPPAAPNKDAEPPSDDDSVESPSPDPA
jgi:translation initiation factor IF-3